MATLTASTYPNGTLYDTGVWSGSTSANVAGGTPRPVYINAKGDSVTQGNAVLIGSGNGLNS
jgi:hypothetical protein